MVRDPSSYIVIDYKTFQKILDAYGDEQEDVKGKIKVLISEHQYDGIVFGLPGKQVMDKSLLDEMALSPVFHLKYAEPQETTT